MKFFCTCFLRFKMVILNLNQSSLACIVKFNSIVRAILIEVDDPKSQDLVACPVCMVNAAPHGRWEARKSKPYLHTWLRQLHKGRITYHITEPMGTP